MKNHTQASTIMQTILPNITIPILPIISSAGKYVKKGKLIKISLLIEYNWIPEYPE